jgi:hypothetical protein
MVALRTRHAPPTPSITSAGGRKAQRRWQDHADRLAAAIRQPGVADTFAVEVDVGLLDDADMSNCDMFHILQSFSRIVLAMKPTMPKDNTKNKTMVPVFRPWLSRQSRR